MIRAKELIRKLDGFTNYHDERKTPGFRHGECQ